MFLGIFLKDSRKQENFSFKDQNSIKNCYLTNQNGRTFAHNNHLQDHK